MTMQVALGVSNSTSDQLPNTTTEQTNGVQQTGTSEGLTAPSQPTSTSAADQQQLMNFLYGESSGTVYTGTTNQGTSTGHTFARLGIGTLIIVVVIALAIICQRQLNTFTKPSNSTIKKRSTKRNN